MDERVYSWIIGKYETNEPVSMEDIMAKAKEEAAEFAADPKTQHFANFKASKGWFDKFIRRNKIVRRRRTGTGQKVPDNAKALFVAFIKFLKHCMERGRVVPGKLLH
mmetsp:Transcript_11044/g.14443  ORF Transcript_11044/g.14443 Transcript_11044/m.14443 type:complete len:107 (-) Transcript_11044:65-385(-)